MDQSQSDQRITTFIANLNALDAGGKARLKRSAGKRLDEAQRSLGLFYSLLPRSGIPARQEPAYWLIATLYPLADTTSTGSFGAALHRARSAKYRRGLDRRVEALLDSDEAQLAYRLGQIVRFLHSDRVPINWQSLLQDLLYWDHPNRFVQKQWARDYFGTPYAQPELPTSQDTTTQEKN
jgi:CRISPR system Cascade subunit CasB